MSELDHVSSRPRRAASGGDGGGSGGEPARPATGLGRQPRRWWGPPLCPSAPPGPVGRWGPRAAAAAPSRRGPPEPQPARPPGLAAAGTARRYRRARPGASPGAAARGGPVRVLLRVLCVGSRPAQAGAPAPHRVALGAAGQSCPSLPRAPRVTVLARFGVLFLFFFVRVCAGCRILNRSLPNRLSACRAAALRGGGDPAALFEYSSCPPATRVTLEGVYS